MAVKMEDILTRGNILYMFEKCIINNKGYITVGDLMSAMALLGIELKEDDAWLMIRDADSNRNGRIQYREFKNMIQIMKKM